MKKYVLDSYAVLAYLYNEPGAEKVKEVLVHALNGKAEIFISMVSWAEVAYISKRKSGVGGWETASSSIRRLPIELVPADIELANLAAEFKFKYRFSLASAFVASLSKAKKAELLTGDPEFNELEKELSIKWI
ncbi:MAG: hypothetical protein A2X45_14425 [Lentisphaerae bacterium GWF2_50_93]|nr:MAG: hypothetical protein A2X45_14425 [Lentisphaerae bacterium GWF2_50_93]